jgi:hypothetical protein
MKFHLKTIAVAMLLAVPGLALAQTDTHHASDAAVSAEIQIMSPEMMRSMMG